MDICWARARRVLQARLKAEACCRKERRVEDKAGGLADLKFELKKKHALLVESACFKAYVGPMKMR